MSGLQERILHDPGCMERLLADLSINVTAMFRDPGFHRALRERGAPGAAHAPVRPRLGGGLRDRARRSSRWRSRCARRGCSSARGSTPPTWTRTCWPARARGAFALDKVRDYTRNYLAAGGDGGLQRLLLRLRRPGDVRSRRCCEPVVFAQHNLATDHSFNEFNVVICRNVLIYFGRDLQDRVLRLFDESLPRRGVLALGRKETLRGTAIEDRYEAVVEAERIYRTVMTFCRLIVIGASWGGLHAVGEILAGLPADFRPHRARRPAPRRGFRRPARRAAGPPRAAARARGGGQGPAVGRGRAGRAGGLPRARRARPLRALHGGGGALQPALDRRDAGVRGRRARRPSWSASCSTGANDDGAVGLAAVRARGGFAIVQNPATARWPRCRRPRAASAQVVAELPEIAALLTADAGRRA